MRDRPLLVRTARKLGAALAALAALAPRAASAAPPATRAEVVRGFPCAGCLIQLPPRVTPDRSGGSRETVSPTPPAEGEAPTTAPPAVLVVLHGDEGAPGRVFGLWQGAAAKAGVLLFAPRCPRDLGCAGSWWRWNGDATWLIAQVDAVVQRHAADPARVYLSGWSGGATYISYQRADFGGRFAAINLSGGGSPPGGGACAPCPAPVHYLMGHRNPLFANAEGARDFLERCGHPVTWDLLPGADHTRELRAYSSPERTAAILAWLTARPNRCLPDAGADAGAPDAGANEDAGAVNAPREAGIAPGTGAGRANARPANAGSRPPGEVKAGARCLCGAGAGAAEGDALNIGVLAALMAKRRSGRRRAPPR